MIAFTLWCYYTAICDYSVTVLDALKKYHSINRCLPERIIVYRDGVGDGQIATVVEHEVKQLQQAVRSLSEQR